jgi:hypothetical protein
MVGWENHTTTAPRTPAETQRAMVASESRSRSASSENPTAAAMSMPYDLISAL